LPLGYVAGRVEPIPILSMPSAASHERAVASEHIDKGVKDSDGLRVAMARLAAGVAVVAARDGDGFRGLTVTSLTSVSLAPPLVLVCLDHLSQTRELVLAERVFTISVLARNQDFLADRFSARAPAVDRHWREVAHQLTAQGLPIIAGAPAWLECRVTDVLVAGDHDIVVASVTAAASGPGDPLILWDREFWTIG
jgi:flavin reductase (DIM6/NTAB) family NADH-FMN oxidoreductase RutF